jgi:drug/metabolite transporter (DMT)-like permease
MMQTKDTFSIGFGFLFSCGFIGLISLAIELIKTPQQLQLLDLIDILGPAMVGCFTAGGIVLANISAGLGVAGISNSIIHSSLVVVTVFNYFVLNQLISFEQSIGVVLTVIGGMLLALGTTCCGGSDTEQE